MSGKSYSNTYLQMVTQTELDKTILVFHNITQQGGVVYETQDCSL